MAEPPDRPDLTVLAMETAGAACSVALWSGRLIAHQSLSGERGHAVHLVPMIAAVLAEAGLTLDEVDRLAVTVGPGSFTGLRVGLATARGLVLACARPLVGLTSFTVIAAALPAGERHGRALLVAVESRRLEPYLQLFDADLQPVGAPVLVAPGDCLAWLAAVLPEAPLLVAGDGALVLREALAGRSDTVWAAGSGQPDAAVLARCAAALAEGEGLPPRPLYLRPPDVSGPAKVLGPCA